MSNPFGSGNPTKPFGSGNPFGSGAFVSQPFGNPTQGATETVTTATYSFSQQASSTFGQGTGIQSGAGFTSTNPTSGLFAVPPSSSGLVGVQSTGTGTQSTFSPVFNQISTAGKNPFGQATSTADKNPFGQVFSPSTGSNQISGSVFGQANASVNFGVSSQASSSVFGQGSTNVGFRQQVTSTSNQDVSGSFGKSTGSAFGQTSSQTLGQTSSSAFGQPVSSPGFGQTSAFGQPVSQTSTSSQPASSVAASSASQTPAIGPNPFAITSSNAFPSSASLFGKTKSSAVPTTSSSPVSQGLFTSGANSATASIQGGEASKGLFSQPAAFGASPSSGMFGKSAPMSAGTFGGESSNVSKQSENQTKPSQENKLFTGGVNAEKEKASYIKPVGLFGEVKEEKGRQTSGLFGKLKKEQAGGLFGKIKEERKEQDSELFGNVKGEFSRAVKEERDVKPNVFEARKNTEQSTARLFGKTDDREKEKSSASRGLFGKPSAGAAGRLFSSATGGLFGKGGSTTAQKTSISRVKDEPEDTAEDTKYGRHEQKTSSGGMFGKPTVREKTSQGLFGKPGPVENKGLFGRPAVSSDEKVATTRPRLKRQISEDLSQKVSLLCKNLPPKYIKSNNLRQHFSRFGEVTRIFPTPNKQQAKVHFKTHEDAAKAKRFGVIPGVSMFWGRYEAPSSPKISPTQEVPEMRERAGRPLKRTSETALMSHSKRRSGHDSPDVGEEIASMAGTSDVGFRRDPSPGPSHRNDDSPGPRPQLQRSPEKRPRAASPKPALYGDKKDKVSAGAFEGVTARTTSDRVQLLVYRDRYIRQNLRRQKNIAKAFVGTCPDMCSEKERYDREDKRRLHYYEIVPGTENIPGRNPLVEHSRAVKEYSRSSPDQDDPLPHELRPVSVLSRTMTYLLREIANRGEDGRWGDWFDFLWDRTRGIRKDVTQQQLCDHETAGLVERCARFHIYCSERLCEEDAHTFDLKINNENLTKCLQTLREFYVDLEKKQRSYCINEVEFRAYTVLMNLNEGDTLREVQQLRPEIRMSPQIKFVLQVYFSLCNNNYIRFFRLLKQASFGNACIMHRYFTQVRNRALLSMMKGYRPGSRSAQIPLSELVRILAFESEVEAEAFCGHYGFDVADGEVILDRKEYIEPEAAWAPHRAVNLIESKLMVSPGEMMNGEAFSNVPDITPSSSFDDYDRFHSAIQLPGEAADNIEIRGPPSPGPIQAPTAPVPVMKEEPVVPMAPRQEQTPPPPPRPHVPSELVKDTAKVLFWEVMDTMCVEISQEVMSDVQNKLQFSEYYMQFIIQETMQEKIKGLCEEVYDESLAEKHAALKAELEQRRGNVTTALMEEMVQDLVRQEALNLATIEVREIKAQLKKESVDRVTVIINQDIITEVLKDMTNDVADEVFETDVTQRLKQLDEFENIVKLSRAGRFFLRWKREYKAVTKLKRAMQAFPSAPNMETLGAQVNSLICVDDPSIAAQQFYVNKRARLTMHTPMEVSELNRKVNMKLTVLDLYSMLKVRTAWQPLDMTKVVARQLYINTDLLNFKEKRLEKFRFKTTFWKMLLCLPDEPTQQKSLASKATKELCTWLRAKFSKGTTLDPANDDKIPCLSTYKCDLPDPCHLRGFGLRKLGVCVRAVEGTLDDEEVKEIEQERVFLGTGGLVFVLPADPPIYEPDAPYWRENCQRLERVLAACPGFQEFPMVIIVAASAYLDVSYDHLSHLMSLPDLINDLQLMDIHVIVYDMDKRYVRGVDVVNPEASEKLCMGLQFLAWHTKPPPSLTVSYLKDVLADKLLEFFYTPMQQNLAKRRTLGYLNQDPNSLLELYNSVIDHVTNVLISDSLKEISWPVPEFTHDDSRDGTDIPPRDWNCQETFGFFDGELFALELPAFQSRTPDSEEWYDVERDLWMYVSRIAGSVYGSERMRLTSRLRNLLRKVERDFEETCSLVEGKAHCQPTYINVPWSTFISMCIDFKLESLQDGIIGSLKNEMRVAYIEEEMKAFTPPPAWQHIESERSILDTPSLRGTIHTAVVKAKAGKKTVKPEICIVDDPDNVPRATEVAKKTSSSLLQSMQAERRRSDHFQKYLESVMDTDEATSMDTDASRTDMTFDGDISEFNLSQFVNPRRLSFNATNYFGNAQSDLSKLFDETNSEKQSDINTRRKSDIALQELSVLTGSRRRERLSEVFGDDAVMMCLKEKTVTDELESLQEGIKSSRRQSDLFDKKLQSLLASPDYSFNEPFGV